MVKYTRITAASLALAAAAACGGGDKAKADSLKQDSALAANLALANKDTATPKLADTATGGAMTKTSTGSKTKTSTTKTKTAPPATKPATTPAPAATKPAPTPAKPTSGEIAAGTTISLASNAEVCTDKNKVGDEVTANTTEAVSGSNGVAIPAGAVVHMTVTTLKRSENTRDPVVMEFRVTRIEFGGKSYSVDASVADADVTKVRDESKAKDVQKVAVGAAAGAIAGKILGKSTKATVIGGAAGAAVGAGAAAATANYQGCIKQGAKIVVKLDAPLTLAVGT